MKFPDRPSPSLPLLAGAVVLVGLLAAGLARFRAPGNPLAQTPGQPAKPRTAQSPGSDPAGSTAPQDELRGTLFLAIGIGTTQGLTSAMLEEQKRQSTALVQAFRQLHPGVTVSVAVYREDQLDRELGARHAAGFGPDLMLVNGSTAHNLERLGLARPRRFPNPVTRQLTPSVLRRAQLPDGSLVGMPVFQQPQLACFNRRRLPSSPSDLAGLLRASGQDVEVGLAITPGELFWTAGSLGAAPAIQRAAEGQRLSSGDHRAILGWLRWLQAANLQERVNYFPDDEALIRGMVAGRLDWIPCRSASLSRLRHSLGDQLGVASLPGGPGGEPTPINRLRMLAFGVDSSPAQRRLADALARFSINPLIQRELTVSTQEVLPVNRYVPAPVASSAVLAALVAAQRQGEVSNRIAHELPASDPRFPQLLRELVRLVFGETTPEQATDALIALMRPSP